MIFWPFRHSNVLEVIALALAVGTTLGIIPIAWWLSRTRFGGRVAGPLWILLFFELAASAYAFATPPWQNPDEPQHLVYVEVMRRAGPSATARLAEGRARPADLTALREVDGQVVDSLRDHDSVRWLPGAREAIHRSEVPGPRQFSHAPVYYVAGAALTAPLSEAPVEARLAMLRSLGVAAASVAVWAAGAAGRVLWPDRRRLAEAPAVIVAAVPSYAVFGGAVNSDMLAMLLGALFLLLVVVGVARPPAALARALPWAGITCVLMIAGALSTRTFLPLLAVVPVAVALRARWRRTEVVATLVVAQLMVALVVLTSPATRLALWDTDRAGPDARCRDGRVGDWSICIPATRGHGVSQAFALARVPKLRHTSLRVSFWVRASQPDQRLAVAFLQRGARQPAAEVRPGESWDRVAIDVTPSGRPSELALLLEGRGGGTVRVDDVRVVRSGSERNELSNGSAEQATRRPPAALPSVMEKPVAEGFDAVDRILRRPGRLFEARGVLAGRFGITFGMFWATAGGRVPPPRLPALLLAVLGLITIAGIVGAVRTLRPPSAHPPSRQRGLIAMAVASVVMGVAVLLRSVPPVRPEVISGRYAFPAMVAIAVTLAAGWRELSPQTDAQFRRALRWAMLVPHALFLAFVFLPFVFRP